MITSPSGTWNHCSEPCRIEQWAGEQLEFGCSDPDWPGHPQRPDGDGWIWVKSVADLLVRFCNLLPLGSGQRPIEVDWADIEIIADANDEKHLRAVHERLYMYGFHSGAGPWAHGYRERGHGVGLDIEGRGGAWVRRIPESAVPSWVFGEDEDDEG